MANGDNPQPSDNKNPPAPPANEPKPSEAEKAAVSAGAAEKAATAAATSSSAAEKAATTAATSSAAAEISAKAATASQAKALQAKTDAENAAAAAAASASKRPWPYVVTLILVLGCLVAAFVFGVDAPTSSDPKLVEASYRMHITTLVCFLGMAFACLGFGLFLVGASGSFKGSSTGGGGVINVETAAPGLVVMVCATIVIYLGLDVIKPPAPSSSPSPATGSNPKPIESAPPIDAGTPPSDAALAPDAVSDAGR